MHQRVVGVSIGRILWRGDVVVKEIELAYNRVAEPKPALFWRAAVPRSGGIGLVDRVEHRVGHAAVTARPRLGALALQFSVLAIVGRLGGCGLRRLRLAFGRQGRRCGRRIGSGRWQGTTPLQDSSRQRRRGCRWRYKQADAGWYD